MFGTIRKHSTWLWTLIIGATIIAFVVFFTPDAEVQFQGGQRVDYGTMNGRPVTRQEFRQANREVNIGFFLRYGSFPDGIGGRQMGFDVGQETRSRLVLLDQLRQMGVVVSDAAVADWILRNFGSMDQPGEARANYTALLERLRRSGISEQDFNDFIRNEIGLSHLVAVAGVAGKLVTPREAARQYRLQNERIEAEAVLIDSADFVSQVEVTPDELERFFSNRQSAYRTPEQVQVLYVRFPTSDYLDQAAETVAARAGLADELDRLYQTRGAGTFLDPTGQVMTPEDAKQKLRQELAEQEAMIVARREAARFGVELDRIEPLAAVNLANFAAAKGRVVETTPPFAESDPPPVPGAGSRFNNAAFRLSLESPISPSVVGNDGVYLLALDERIPSQVPPLGTVNERVAEDYRRDRARQLAVQAGIGLADTLKTALAMGKTFTEAVLEAGFSPISLPRFTPGATSLPNWDRRIDLRQVQSISRTMQAGDLSDFMQTAVGGFVLFLRQREPVQDAELQEALPEFLGELQESGQFAAFRDWLNRRVEMGNVIFAGDGEDRQEPSPDLNFD